MSRLTCFTIAVNGVKVQMLKSKSFMDQWVNLRGDISSQPTLYYAAVLLITLLLHPTGRDCPVVGWEVFTTRIVYCTTKYTSGYEYAE